MTMPHTQLEESVIMDFKFLNRQHFISLAFLFLSFGVFAQKMTTVKGKIVDAGTKEPIPFATIAFMRCV